MKALLSRDHLGLPASTRPGGFTPSAERPDSHERFSH